MGLKLPYPNGITTVSQTQIQKYRSFPAAKSKSLQYPAFLVI
jgi:hypothetical protein